MLDLQFTGIAQRVADAALGSGGCNDYAIGPLLEQAGQYVDPGRGNPVVVADNDLRSGSGHVGNFSRMFPER
jgi:hypothetical protein